MGATESVLANMEVGEELAKSSGLYRIWSEIRPGIYRQRRKATVFVRYFPETDSKETRGFFDNAIKILRQIRHPCILDLIASSQTKDELCLITEWIRPLDLIVDSLHSIEIHSGLNDVLRGLVFLHDRAGLCHNHLCPSSILVTMNGTWKLGSFECTHNMSNDRYWVQSDFVRNVKELEFIPPEDQEMINNDAPTHARDSFAFGKLVHYLLAYMEGNLDDGIVLELKSVIEKLTSRAAVLRPQLGSVVGNSAFSNELTDLADNLRSIYLKSTVEKNAFFLTLIDRLRRLPPSVVGRHLTKLLLSRYVLLENDASLRLLPYLLQPKDAPSPDGLLPPALFQHYLIPELLRLFHVRERWLRLSLLSHFSRFAPLLNQDDNSALTTIILPELRLGTNDDDDALVAASLHCLSLLVPLIGAKLVVGHVQGGYFSDGTPRSFSNRSCSRNSKAKPSKMKIEEKTKEIESECPETDFYWEKAMPIDNDDADWTNWDSNENLNGLDSESNLRSDTKWISKMAPHFDDKIEERREISLLGAEFDISTLKIECRKSKSINDIDPEMDFFADMEPKCSILEKNSQLEPEASLFSVAVNNSIDESKISDGWGIDWDAD